MMHFSLLNMIFIARFIIFMTPRPRHLSNDRADDRFMLNSDQCIRKMCNFRCRVQANFKPILSRADILTNLLPE